MSTVQYDNYDIQTVEYGCIIRDSSGKYIASTPTEDEAIEYVKDLTDNIKEKPSIDWYRRFEVYCKNLPGKCYPDGDKMATTNGRALTRYIESFTAATNTKIVTRVCYIGGEYFHFVESVEANEVVYS